MKPISPVLPNSPEIPEVVLAENQPEYLPLPSCSVRRGEDGPICVITRWQLSPGDRVQVAITGTIWLEQITFGEPLQPQLPQALEPLRDPAAVRHVAGERLVPVGVISALVRAVARGDMPKSEALRGCSCEEMLRLADWIERLPLVEMERPRRSVPLKNLNDFAAEVHDLACRNGFHPEGQELDEFLPRAAANLHAEVAEYHEAWRTSQLFGACDKAEKMEAAGLRPLTCAEEELADIIIRALDNAHQLGIDIAEAVRIKHAYNCTREYQHGGKKS